MSDRNGGPTTSLSVVSASGGKETRVLTYAEAILEATEEEMERDPRVVLFGLDVDDPKAIQGTTRGLAARFGSGRVFGTPLSEDAMSGVAIGMALAGLRPIHVHIRMDFLMLAMNQLVNMAAKCRYMFGGRLHAPMVVRAMIGKSWGQGPQHSQGLHGMLMHVPGIKVVAPATPADAKGCLVAAIRDDDPVLFVDHRLLHASQGPVPSGEIVTRPGRTRRVAPGGDVTLVGVSQMVGLCERARELLASVGVSAEVLDPVWLSPLDMTPILESAAKTRRLVVVDTAWTACGASAEIAARAAEELGPGGISIRRLGFAPTTCPTTPSLEEGFYPTAALIAATARELLEGAPAGWTPRDAPAASPFRGPF